MNYFLSELTTKSETISCLIGFIIIGLFLSVLVTYLPAFAQTNNTNTSSITNWKTYSSPLYSLKMMYPQDFYPNVKGGELVFRPIEAASTTMMTVQVSDVKPNSTLQHILRQEFSSLRSDSDLNNITMSEPNKTKLRNGIEAYQYQFDYTYQDTGDYYKQFNLLTLNDGFEYLFRFDGLDHSRFEGPPQEEFNRYLPIVKTMIETFQPLGFKFN